MIRKLMSNIQGLAKNSPTRRLPFFYRKWGTDAAFNKTVNKELFVNYPIDQNSDIHEQILIRLKTAKPASQRSLFLAKITDDSSEFVNEQRANAARQIYDEQLCNVSMTNLLDQLFQLLKLYSIELNNSLGHGVLHISSTTPQPVTEVVKFNKMRQAEQSISYYRARLSSSSYSLVLRGDKNGIQFFMVPVAKAIGLSKQECQFLPVASLAMRVCDGKVIWTTANGRPLLPKLVESLCMSLFEKLIEATKEETRKQNAFEFSTAS